VLILFNVLEIFGGCGFRRLEVSRASFTPYHGLIQYNWFGGSVGAAL